MYVRMYVCIFLAELASKSCKLLLPHHGRLCNKWYSAVAETISEGNSIYDRYVDKPGILLDVHDVGETYAHFRNETCLVIAFN